MGENPLVSNGKQCPSYLMENADNLSENINASIKISLPSFSHSAGKVSDAILKVSSGQSLE
jgi:hypothetical protein